VKEFEQALALHIAAHYGRGMRSTEVPVYIEHGKTFHADSCDPLVTAAENGELTLAGLGRGSYPGTRLPDGVMPGVRSIGCWDAKHEQTWGLPWHRNEGIEVTFLEHGSLPFQIGRRTFTLRPGNLTITRPWQPHKLGKPNVGPSRLHWIILDVGMRHPHQDWTWPAWLILTDDDVAELTGFLRGNEKPVWDADTEIARCFRQVTDTLDAGGGAGDASRLLVYINELCLLLLDMFRRQKTSISPSLSTARRSAEIFLGTLDERLAEPWTLAAMAEHCGLGVTRFVHYCKQIANETPMQHLNRRRAEKAAELLRKQPDRTVTDIAFACGFSSSQYFATAFRKTFGCSPRDYRQ